MMIVRFSSRFSQYRKMVTNVTSSCLATERCHLITTSLMEMDHLQSVTSKDLFPLLLDSL